jgi:c-di-GMP-binding flagellar brake protein YcgR
MTCDVIIVFSAMATRRHRNASTITSVGWHFAQSINGTIRAEYVTMIHPTNANDTLDFESFKSKVLSAANEEKIAVVAVVSMDCATQRNVLVANAEDYDLICNTERKMYNRMPVFTVMVKPTPPPPPAPMIRDGGAC